MLQTFASWHIVVKRAGDCHVDNLLSAEKKSLGKKFIKSPSCTNVFVIIPFYVYKVQDSLIEANINDLIYSQGIEIKIEETCFDHSKVHICVSLFRIILILNENGKEVGNRIGEAECYKFASCVIKIKKTKKNTLKILIQSNPPQIRRQILKITREMEAYPFYKSICSLVVLIVFLIRSFRRSHQLTLTTRYFAFAVHSLFSPSISIFLYARTVTIFPCMTTNCLFCGLIHD